MEVKKIVYVRRYPKEDYGFMEVTLDAELSAEDSPAECLEELKEIIDGHISGNKTNSVKGEKNNGSKKSASKEVSQEDDKEKDQVIAPPKRRATKTTPYDRKNDLHKKLVAEYLDEAMPVWKEKLPNRAQVVSVKMNGKDFLDADGNILQSFKDEYLKLLKTKPKV